MVHWALALRRSAQAIVSEFPSQIRHSHSAAATAKLYDLRPQYLPFEITPEEAKKRYQEWQSTKWLAPRNILSSAGSRHHLTPVLLPYWHFTLKAKIQYTGTVGTPTKGKEKESFVWRHVNWTTIPELELSSSSSPQLQIQASYQHRRDFTEAMKTGVDLRQLQQLNEAQVEAAELQFPRVLQKNSGVAVKAPTMRKGIAWEFALRGAHEIALAMATEALKRENKGVEAVKDVHVLVSPSAQQAKLVYLPAFSLVYIHGQGHNAHGERHAQQYHALISGLRNGGVAGERHISAQKAAVAGGAVTLGFMSSVSLLSILLGGAPIDWTIFDFMFSTLTVAATSGLIAQMFPSFLHRNVEDRQQQVEAQIEAAAAAAAAAAQTAPPHFFGEDDDSTGADVLDETHRTNLEWTRWEEVDKRAWNPVKREQWAQQLFEAQHFRRRERVRLQREAEKERLRRRSEEIREQRRRSRWGSKSSQSHFSQHDFLGGSRRKADFKGYYKALDLDPTGGHVSQDDIKRAFRKAARRWHPDVADKQMDAVGQKKAREHFQLIRTAYDILKDPDQRKNYDLGLKTTE